MSIQAVIFDLDGVIVSTDSYHYMAWKRMADEEGIPFDSKVNQRLRGVSRMDSLEIILEKSPKAYTDAEKVELASRKNRYYRDLLQTLTPGNILPGVMKVIAELKRRGIKVAIGSSSKNTQCILEQIELKNQFDVVVDGNQISKSKPDPEVFLLAAKQLNVPPENCVVVEDAYAGIEAAKRGGMKAVGVGFAQTCDDTDYAVEDLNHITVETLLCV